MILMIDLHESDISELVPEISVLMDRELSPLEIETFNSIFFAHSWIVVSGEILRK